MLNKADITEVSMPGYRLNFNKETNSYYTKVNDESVKPKERMDPLSFAYWLQGYFELTDSGQQMSAQQVQIIKDHLDLVFTKVTPNYTPISSNYFFPFVGDGITDESLKPIEYCGMPPVSQYEAYYNGPQASC